MLERRARRHARALCRFANRDMFDPTLLNNLDGNRDKRVGEIAMVIGPGARCFLGQGFCHAQELNQKPDLITDYFRLRRTPAQSSDLIVD